MNLEDLYRLLRGAHAQAQSIVDTVPLAAAGPRPRPLRPQRQPRLLPDLQGRARRDPRPTPYELGNGQWDIPELRHLLEAVIPKSAAVVDYEVAHDFPNLGRRTMLLTARKLPHPAGSGGTFLLAIEDATERRRHDEEQDLLLDELRHRVKNLLTLVQALAHQTEAAGRTGEEYRDDFLGRFALWSAPTT